MINYSVLGASIILATTITLVVIYVFGKVVGIGPFKRRIKQNDKQLTGNTSIPNTYTTQSNLSLQEITRLSWKFLHDIAQIVLKKFSYEEQNILISIGTRLYNIGMRYKHEINTEAIKQNYSKNVTKSKTTQRSK